MRGHALDYDDVQFGAHVSSVLVAAILAKAETCNVSGLDALRAYVAGYEVWGELHSREPEPYHDKGWHPTAVMGRWRQRRRSLSCATRLSRRR